MTNCDQDNICDTQMVVERIKIDGNTFVHKVHGNYFMEVDAESAHQKLLLPQSFEILYFHRY